MDTPIKSIKAPTKPIEAANQKSKNDTNRPRSKSLDFLVRKPDSKAVQEFTPLFHPHTTPLICRFAITTSEKPTNTAFALMCTSPKWFLYTKQLFNFDATVWSSFGTQLLSKTNFDKNLFWAIQINIFLKQKLPEYKAQESLTKSITDTNSFRLPILGDTCCPEIMTNLPLKINLEENLEITHAEFLTFFKLAFPWPQFESLQFKNLGFDILLQILKNLSEDSHFTASRRISAALSTLGENNSNESQYDNKLSILIEKFGDYFVKENSSSLLKNHYFALLLQFFKLFNWNPNKTNISKDVFENLSVKFIKLLPNCKETPIPVESLKLIYLLKDSEKYAQIADIVQNLKKNTHFFNFENFLKLPEEFRIFFIIEGIEFLPVHQNILELFFDIVLPKENKTNYKLHLFCKSSKKNFHLITSIFKKIPQKEQSEALNFIKARFAEISIAKLEDNNYKFAFDGFTDYLESLLPQ